MIDADGWQTVYATGGFVRPEQFLVSDIRAAIEVLRKNALRDWRMFPPPFPPRLIPQDLWGAPPAGGVGIVGFRGPFK